jgi:hypothetical protein
MSFPFLQTYRIADRKVFNCRWTDRLDDWDWSGAEVVVTKWFAMRQASRQLPNRLEQSDRPSKPLKHGSAVTITSMGCDFGRPPSLPEYVTWGNWGARQWIGTSDEVPAEIETFCQAMTQAVSVPEYVKSYRSYLRAVPLFTETDLLAEKDTPLIKLKKTHYHTRYAVQHPYLLIPIPKQEPPFPFIQEYTPGDKFKIREDECYFLIETFIGSD